MSGLVELKEPALPDEPSPESKGVFVHTFGCQMNVYDSERMLERLFEDGYRRIDSPEQADLILVNTCSVRDKAEQKLLSALGVYRRHKEARDGVLICVAGCVAQQERAGLMSKAPFVDIVMGPDEVSRISELVKRAIESRRRVLETNFTEPTRYVFPRAEPKAGSESTTAFVTIQKGCDKVCTYCIVPFTRGREVSRPVDEILDEVRRFVGLGVGEVTLIGQNVNCYSGGCSFSELLYAVAEVPGLVRLRYSTSHPREMGDDVFTAHERISTLCPHLHLPVQSGSDKILSLMRREHGIEEYKEKVARLRAIRPDIALTTDIIVGFPGETEEDFQATMDLVEEIRFTNMYSFVYSDRPRTWAARNGASLGILPFAAKVERLQRLQRRQRQISDEHAKHWLGREVEVLVEGTSKRDPSRRRGHTGQNWMVHFRATGEEAPTGVIALVEVERATHVGLSGKLAGILLAPAGSGKSHA